MPHPDDDPPDAAAHERTDTAAHKRTARAAARARRRALIMPDPASEARRTELLLSLPEVAALAAGSTVACYVARCHEPGTQLLLDAFSRRRLRVLLPVVLADLDLDWAVDTGDHAPGLGPAVLEPTGPRLGVDAIAHAGVVVTPALAVDRRGHRLGRGGGCYDRALARRRPDAFVVALLHDGEIQDDDLPADEHDQRVHAAVTPGGVERFTW
jgi:5-formyltetrahydrofolate cyclo-ligase